MDRRDRNRNTNILIDGKDINRQIDGQTEKEQKYKYMNRHVKGIDRQIDGQMGKEQKYKQMHKWERYKQKNGWIDRKE